jgi:uncharacterized membrane protein
VTDWSFNPIFDSAAAVAAIAGLLVLLSGVTLLVRRTPPRRAAVLVALRLAVVSILTAAMLQPTATVTRVKTQTATLVLLVDTSRSMLVPDMRDGRTRWEVLRRVIEAARPDLAALAAELKVKCYGFDAATRALTFDDGEGLVTLPQQPAGDQSALGAALDEVLRLERGERLAGVIVISDGTQRTLERSLPPHEPARRMADQGYPLYTIGLGGEPGGTQIRDVAVSNLAAGPTVYVKNQLDVRADITIAGFGQNEVQLELLWGRDKDLRLVGRKTIRAAPGAARQSVSLDFVPETPGEHKLVLRAPTLSGELVTTNNEAVAYVSVLAGGLKVLYLEGGQGAQRIEQSFLRRSLAASQEIQVDYVRCDPKFREQWPLKLDDRFAPGKYDVYVLGDLDSDAFLVAGGDTPERRYPQLELLRAAIERNAGFIMLGGFHSFAPGGYGDTPLAKLLPLQFDKLERQRYDEPIRKDLHHPGPLKMRPASQADDHPVLRLAPASQLAEVWNRLPPLDGANIFAPDKIKPAAKTLAEAPLATGGATAPLLLSMEYGNGRVLAFSGDSTWRWRMQGHEAAHKRFWRQVILWLAKKDTDEGEVWVRPERRVVAPGQPLRFTAGARTPEGDPVTDAVFTVQLQSPAANGTKTTPLSIVRQGETWSGTIVDVLPPGEHSLRVTARRGDPGAPGLGEAQARFVVESKDLELSQPAADTALLAALSRITETAGGRTIFPEQLPSLLDELKKKPKELDIEIPDRWTFGAQTTDGALVLVLFVTLLGIEWFLRKKWGLV